MPQSEQHELTFSLSLLASESLYDSFFFFSFFEACTALRCASFLYLPSSTLGSLQLQCSQVGAHSQSSLLTSEPQHLSEQCVSFSDSFTDSATSSNLNW